MTLPPEIQAAYAVLDPSGECVCVCGANDIESVFSVIGDFAGDDFQDRMCSDASQAFEGYTWRLVSIEDARQMFGKHYDLPTPTERPER